MLIAWTCNACVQFGIWPAIFKIVSSFREAAKRAAERLQEVINKEEEEVEETPVVEEVVVSEPAPSAEVVLLTEIRDLLSKKESNE